MTNPSLENLPPEMQARIQGILQQAQQQPQQQAAPAAPAPGLVKPPSLMDHVIALRQEVNQLSQQVEASSRVMEAVGNAVGQMYGMFQEQTTASNFSTTFQAQGSQVDTDEY